MRNLGDRQKGRQCRLSAEAPFHEPRRELASQGITLLVDRRLWHLSPRTRYHTGCFR